MAFLQELRKKKKKAKETRIFWKEMATTSQNAKKANKSFKKRHHSLYTVRGYTTFATNQTQVAGTSST